VLGGTRDRLAAIEAEAARRERERWTEALPRMLHMLHCTVLMRHKPGTDEPFMWPCTAGTRAILAAMEADRG
jgi:hypothetical protein